jgi:hypothetical protein
MKTMPRAKKARLERGCQFVDAGSTGCERYENPPNVYRGRTDPQVNVLGESRGSIEDTGLSADEKVIDPEALKASEETSHREWPAGS